MAYVYAYPGPPFNFLGTLSETQRDAFKTWVNARQNLFPAVQSFYQIRANNLRKTAGVLEKYYSLVTASTSNPELLAPTFQKIEWQPGSDGYFVPAPRNDHIPMVTVSAIKKYYKQQLQRQDESVFHMNHLRNLIEKTEDLAQYANDAVSQVPPLQNQLDGLFAQAQYQAVLVKDQTDQYAGQPRFRVNPLDAPTTWELEQHNKSTPGAKINVKFVDKTF